MFISRSIILYQTHLIVHYIEPPDPPVNVTVPQHGGNWVLLQWQLAYTGNLPITSFLIHQRTVNSTNFTPVANSTNFTLVASLTYDVHLQPTNFTLHNISSGISQFTYYQYVVEACNALGCSAGVPSPIVFTDEYSKFYALYDLCYFLISNINPVFCSCSKHYHAPSLHHQCGRKYCEFSMHCKGISCPKHHLVERGVSCVRAREQSSSCNQSFPVFYHKCAQYIWTEF